MNPITLTHPLYGSVQTNTPYNVRACDKVTQQVIDFPNYTLFFTDDDVGAVIIGKTRNSCTGAPLKTANNIVSLSRFKDPKGFLIHNVMLTSAFPDINPFKEVERTCDPNDNDKTPTAKHEDANRNNNRITNLNWDSRSHVFSISQTKSDTAIKSDTATAQKQYTCVAPKGQLDQFAVFDSRYAAGEYVRVKYMEANPTKSMEVKEAASKITSMCNGKRKSAYGFVAWNKNV